MKSHLHLYYWWQKQNLCDIALPAGVILLIIWYKYKTKIIEFLGHICISGVVQMPCIIFVNGQLYEM